jgi:aldose 1-epimerase
MIEEVHWTDTKVFNLETNRFKARLSPAHGANLFSLFDKKFNRHIFRSPSSEEELYLKPQYFGTPVLFPPNRTEGARFNWRDEEFLLPANTPEGNNIHGVAFNRPWL